MISTAEPTPRRAVETVLIVGAGPAGLAAAVQTATSGLSTTLIDAAASFGGEFWRHGGSGLDDDLHHDVAGYRSLAEQAERLIGDGRLRHLPRHQVWTLSCDADSCTAYLIDGRDSGDPTEIAVTADYLILAGGAYDRPVPFPGWDLPGVMTAGAAQSLLKGHGVVVGPRVLVAGTGPFLLPAAAGLAHRGAEVLGVCEANRPSRWLSHPRALVSQPRKLAEAAGYVATLAKRRIPIFNRTIVVAAHGTERLETVTVARLDRKGAIRPASQRRIAVDVLAIGCGFSVKTDLPLLAGCRMHTTADNTLAVAIDQHQATSHPRVYAAGEATGVGGARLAVVEGTLAGAAVARAAGANVYTSRKRMRRLATERARLRRFADAMHAVYPVPPAWMDVVTPDTIVCRCEEVTVAEIDGAVDLGARDTHTVKMLSRAGMGWCQGRECAYATSCLTARRVGRQPDLSSSVNRPVVTPLPLSLVAHTPTPPR